MSKALFSDDTFTHWQNDPVELIKASPGPRLRQALEDPSETLVVHLVGTVEDHAVFPQGFSHVLHRLRFPSSWYVLSFLMITKNSYKMFELILSAIRWTKTCRAGWGSSHTHAKCLNVDDIMILLLQRAVFKISDNVNVFVSVS